MNIEEYYYDLPEEKIAKFPLEERDNSRLLVYRQGKIQHQVFKNVSQFIPSGSTLFFNETRVIPARLIFHKSSRGRIEVFLLEPVNPSRIMQIAMESKSPVTWRCMIGNLKKWKDQYLLVLNVPFENRQIQLSASLIQRSNMEVMFEWDDPEVSFSEIITAAGSVPLPPYIHREVIERDKLRYQTVYSKVEGAVAAPTAGLHFTSKIIRELEAGGIKLSHLTLHVSAGTFQPIKVNDAKDHPMHEEQIVVNLDNIISLMEAENVIAVGTTSLRTLESLYWYGTLLFNDPDAPLCIKKLFPYEKPDSKVSLNDAFSAIYRKMKKDNVSQITGTTEIFIFPGYDFKVCNGLITNYHLPGSTLILLVAAFVGEDWKNIYKEALDHNYRFLSYGDSSLLIK